MLSDGELELSDTETLGWEETMVSLEEDAGGSDDWDDGISTAGSSSSSERSSVWSVWSEGRTGITVIPLGSGSVSESSGGGAVS